MVKKTFFIVGMKLYTPVFPIFLTFLLKKIRYLNSVAYMEKAENWP